MIELKPCPFCGCSEITIDYDANQIWTIAWCDDCLAEIEVLDRFYAEDKASDKWNTRPIEDAQASRIAILEMAVRALREIEWVECGYDGELLTCPRCSGMHPDTGDGDIKVYNLGKRGHAQDCPWLTSGELLEAK